MCVSRPKIIQAPPPPRPVVPVIQEPSEVADIIENRADKKRRNRKRTGNPLTIRRPSVSTAMSGESGANINY